MRGEGREGVFVGKEEPREKRGTRMKGTREKVGVKCVRARLRRTQSQSETES